MPYDATLYQGSAAYYANGRPQYSRALITTLAAEVGLDGLGRILDVGCGPGTLAIGLADRVEEVIGLDPDGDMLAEGARGAVEARTPNIRWVQALAEEIPELSLGRFRLVTFGQSFHWTDRRRVAESVYDILEPGGAMALIDHAHEGRPQPTGPGYPPIPHKTIRAMLGSYLGPRRPASQGFASRPADRHEVVLARTRFGSPRRIRCSGRADIVRDIDGVLANYFSTSSAAPHVFGDQREQFEADVRAALLAHSPTGLFWDWPGDTEILLAIKPG
jgi:SAM-dependent methyltransferase